MSKYCRVAPISRIRKTNKVMDKRNLEMLESKISSARIVDYDRYFACTPEIITLFFSSLEKCIREIPPPLVFGADELILEPTLKKNLLFLKIYLNLFQETCLIKSLIYLLCFRIILQGKEFHLL